MKRDTTARIKRGGTLPSFEAGKKGD
jgi:hypothetical protein